MCYAPPGNSQTWWTEAHAAWAEAYALILILAVDSVLAYFALRERREARKESAEERQARQEERWQRSELQLERQRADENKMRNDVTCLGVREFRIDLNEEQTFAELWRLTNKQAGFAVELEMHDQLPQYLLRKCEAHSREIAMSTSMRPVNPQVLVFKFPNSDPYPGYGP